MKFVLATHNEHKIREFQRILEPLGIEIVTEVFPDVNETGITFMENARIKAEAACEATGFPAIADDSGICVDALDGAPGVYSARFSGPNATDPENLQKLLDIMKDFPSERRGAHYTCAICCVFPSGDRLEEEAYCYGELAFAPKGDEGFGYDPIFLLNGKSFGETSSATKDEVSHRAVASRKFCKALEQYLKK